MMKTWLKDIKGMWVATQAEGRMLGTINTIYLDPASKRVTGFMLRSGTPLAGEDCWITVDQVAKVGLDLIFVPDEQAVCGQEPSGLRLVRLLGMDVSSKDGKVLGQLHDVAVDTGTWIVTDAAVAPDLSVEIVPGETVLGEDMILLQAGAQPAPRTDLRKRENLVDAVLGKDFFKQTSDALKKILKGAEARLRRPGDAESSPSSAEPSSSDKPSTED